jgi:hypothetical protein
MPTPEQVALREFYEKVTFHSPLAAALMSEDILILSSSSMMDNPELSQRAADSLRRKALDMPEEFRARLEFVLDGFGNA